MGASMLLLGLATLLLFEAGLHAPQNYRDGSLLGFSPNGWLGYTWVVAGLALLGLWWTKPVRLTFWAVVGMSVVLSLLGLFVGPAVVIWRVTATTALVLLVIVIAAVVTALRPGLTGALEQAVARSLSAPPRRVQPQGDGERDANEPSVREEGAGDHTSTEVEAPARTGVVGEERGWAHRVGSVYRGAWAPLLGDFAVAAVSRRLWRSGRDRWLMAWCGVFLLLPALPLVIEAAKVAGVGTKQYTPRDCVRVRDERLRDFDERLQRQRGRERAGRPLHRCTPDEAVAADFGNPLALALALFMWPAVLGLSGWKERAVILGDSRTRARAGPDVNWPLLVGLLAVELVAIFALVHEVSEQAPVAKGVFWGLALASAADISAAAVAVITEDNKGAPLYAEAPQRYRRVWWPLR